MVLLLGTGLQSLSLVELISMKYVYFHLHLPDTNTRFLFYFYLFYFKDCVTLAGLEFAGPTYLCFLSVVIKGMCHHAQEIFFYFIECHHVTTDSH